MQYVAPRGISLNHMSMGSIVAAEGEAAGGRIRGSRRTNRAGVAFDVAGFVKATVGKNRQHRDGTAEVIGDEQKTARRMNTHISGAAAAGVH